jgi:hypothetical protein
MRLVAIVMVLMPAVAASAQEPPPPLPTQPLVAPPLPPPTEMPPPDPRLDQTLGAPSVRATMSKSIVRQWRGARVMNGFANVIGLLSTGLSLSSSIYVAAAHYPPSVNDLTSRPSPGDPAQALSYVSSTSAAFAFGLSAGGLALRHHILRKLDADTGRGLFIGGTVVGLVGIAAIAVSYIVGFSNIGNTHDQGIAVLATSLGGSAICTVGTAIYAKDASNVQKVWKGLTTF